MYAPNVIGKKTTDLASKLEKQRLSLLKQGKDFPRVEDLARTWTGQDYEKGTVTHSYDIAACPGKVVVIPALVTTSGGGANVKADTASQKLAKVDKIGVVCIGEINGKIETKTIMPSENGQCLEDQLASMGFEGTLLPITQANKYKVVEIPNSKHLFGKLDTLATEETRVSLVSADAKGFFGNLKGDVNEIVGVVKSLSIEEDERNATVKTLLARWAKELQEKPRAQIPDLAR